MTYSVGDVISFYQRGYGTTSQIIGIILNVTDTTNTDGWVWIAINGKAVENLLFLNIPTLKPTIIGHYGIHNTQLTGVLYDVRDR